MIVYSQNNINKVASDSDSNSDQQQKLEMVLQSQQQKHNNTQQKVELSECAKFALALIIIGIILAVIFLVHTLLLTTSHSLEDMRIPKQVKPQRPKVFQPQDSTNIANTQQKIQPKQQKPQSISTNSMSKVGLKNAFFLHDSSAPNQNVNWFIKREAICIPNQKLSFRKTSQGFILQNTAYQNINLFTQNLLGLQKLYQMENIRQFAKNLSIYFPNLTIIFDHHDPYLLTLITRYFGQGIFVSQQNNWKIMQKNLIFNDLRALVTVKERKTLLQWNKKQLIVTEDPNLAVESIIRQKRQHWILVSLYQPFTIQAQYFAQMHIYQLSLGKQCVKRTINLLEMKSKLEKKVILNGWYLFTSAQTEINFGLQVFNYSVSLTTNRAIQCEEFISEPLYLKNNKMYIRKLPFKQHHFLSYDGKLSSGYRQIYGLINNLNISGKVYLQSGPCELLLVTIFSFQKNLEIYLNPLYQEKKLIFKNLVLNNEQRVKIPRIKTDGNQFYSLIVTKDHESISQNKSKIYLFINDQSLKPSPNYNYSLIVSEQCSIPKLRSEAWQLLPQGVFLVKKSSRFLAETKISQLSDQLFQS